MDKDTWGDPAPIDSAADQTARDLEFELVYTAEMPEGVAVLMCQGARALELGLFCTAEIPTLVSSRMCLGAQAAAATDTAQEAMLEAYRKWDVLDVPRAWVRKVAARAWWRPRRTENAERPQDRLP